MFCGKCGFKCDDDSMFCTNCGAKVGSAQPLGSVHSVGNARPVGGGQSAGRGGDNRNKGKGNRNKGKGNRNEGEGNSRNRKVGMFAVAIAAVCFIVAAIKIVTMFGGGGYEKPAEIFIEALTGSEEVDAETFLKQFPKKVIENEMEEHGYSMEELTDELRSDMRDMARELKDYEISYEILSAENVTGDEWKNLKDSYKDMGIKISAAKNVKFLCTVEFRGNTEEVTPEICVVKVKNSWYIDVISFGGIV